MLSNKRESEVGNLKALVFLQRQQPMQRSETGKECWYVPGEEAWPVWLEHMEQEERGGQKIGRDWTIQSLVGNGKEFGFYTKRMLGWQGMHNLTQVLTISLWLLFREWIAGGGGSGSRETRWRVTEVGGMNDDGTLDLEREVERSEYAVKVESINLLPYIELQ